MPISDQEQYEMVCRGRFDRLEGGIERLCTKIDRMDEGIRGTGNGVPGLAERVRTLEEDRKGRVRLRWLIVSAIVNAVVWPAILAAVGVIRLAM